MVVRPLAAVLIAVTALIVGFLFFGAQGAPGTPAVSLATQLNPSAAQTLAFTVSANYQSIQTPNTVLLFGNFAVWSLYSGTTAISVNQSVGLTPVSAGGSPYLIASPITVPVPALCTSCASYVENLTMTVTVFTHTYWGIFASSGVFHFGGGNPPSPTVPGPAPNGVYWYELGLPVGIGVTLVGVILLAFGPRSYWLAVPIVGGLAGVAAVALPVLMFGVR